MCIRLGPKNRTDDPSRSHNLFCRQWLGFVSRIKRRDDPLRKFFLQIAGELVRLNAGPVAHFEDRIVIRVEHHDSNIAMERKGDVCLAFDPRLGDLFDVHRSSERGRIRENARALPSRMPIVIAAKKETSGGAWPSANKAKRMSMQRVRDRERRGGGSYKWCKGMPNEDCGGDAESREHAVYVIGKNMNDHTVYSLAQRVFAAFLVFSCRCFGGSLRFVAWAPSNPACERDNFRFINAA